MYYGPSYYLTSLLNELEAIRTSLVAQSPCLVTETPPPGFGHLVAGHWGGASPSALRPFQG
jgi:hypothetical protein